jgi:hypothetical protein
MIASQNIHIAKKEKKIIQIIFPWPSYCVLYSMAIGAADWTINYN